MPCQESTDGYLERINEGGRGGGGCPPYVLVFKNLMLIFFPFQIITGVVFNFLPPL